MVPEADRSCVFPKPERRLRVLHIMTRLLIGGSDEHTLLTVEGLPADRYEFFLGYGPEHDPRQVQRAERAGVHTFVIPRLYNWPAPHLDPIIILRLAHWIRRQRIDIVHTHQTKAGFIGRMAARLAKTPVLIHTCHGLGFGALNSALMDRFILFLERLCGRWTHFTVFVSHHLMQQAHAMGIGRPSASCVIRSGKNLALYREPSRRLVEEEARNGRTRPLTVSCVTRLAPNKGIEDLISAISNIASEFSDLRVWIVGEGPLRERLESMISDKGLDDVVQLLGMRDDVPQILAQTDIAVLPSLREGLPQSLLEAMIAGKAVIATPVGGIPEVIRDGETGLLVPPQRPDHLADAIKKLVDNKELRLAIGERAAQEIGSEFDKEKMLAQYDELYQSLWRLHGGTTAQGE